MSDSKLPPSQSKEAKGKDGLFTGEPREPLEEALNVLSIALRSEYGRVGAATRLRATAEKIEGRKCVGGIILSEISPWDTIAWLVIGLPKQVERLKSMGKKHIDWNPGHSPIGTDFTRSAFKTTLRGAVSRCYVAKPSIAAR